MKHLIVFAICLFGGVSASYLHAAPAIHAPVAVNTGSSTQYRSQDNTGNYAFGYNENHSTGGTFRRESGDSYGNKVGAYGLRDIDGRTRIVQYVADGLGFRASIATNEPGTAAQPAASTSISSPNLPQAPVAHLAEPAIHAPVHAEPVIAHASVHSPHAHLLGNYGLPIGLTGPAAVLPSHLHHGHPGLLAAPSAHYGNEHLAYPIRR